MIARRLATLSAGLLVLGGATAVAGPADDLTSLVNPYVGTENFGNTFPGASAPFGMVQVSPDTGGQGGYDYKQDHIYGFSQTHLSGVGCGVVGELPIMPTTGAVTTGDTGKYTSAYSHDDETASPGYYQVGLSTYGINAELTATDRTGWQRYTFPAGQPANILFNTGKANMPVLDSRCTSSATTPSKAACTTAVSVPGTTSTPSISARSCRGRSTVSAPGRSRC
jgi:putative alpha-1,2-mannosidase